MIRLTDEDYAGRGQARRLLSSFLPTENRKLIVVGCFAGLFTSERFTILFTTPSLNDGKSNRSADKSMSVRNSCRQVIARHPGILVSSA